MVEFALVAPLLVMILFLTVDFGRLMYTYGAIAWATREGARMVSLSPQEVTDCPVLQRVESAGRGFNISPDPKSLVNNSDPNNPTGTLVPTVPPPGQGYIYIWPAVATAAPQDSGNNCNGAPRLGSATARDVALQIQYTYVPLVPWFSSFIPNITIKVVSVVHSEY
jgi:Flp pilus assembly protein TadG